MKTFEVGKAPWEVEDNTSTNEPQSFEVGKAPWEIKLERPMAKIEEPTLYLPEMDMAGEEYNPAPTPNLDLQQKAEESAIDTQALFNRYSTTGNQILGYFGNEEARNKAEAATKNLRKQVLEELKAKGIQGEYTDDGELIVVNEKGEAIPVDPNMFKEMFSQKWEIGGAIGAGITGARLGGMAGALAGPIGTGIGAIAGGAIGAIAGSTAGAGIDALTANMDVVNKASNDVIYSKMYDAGVAAAVLEPLGLLGAKGVEYSARGIKRAYDFILAGNKEGASVELKKYFNATDDQIAEVIAKVENLQGPLPGTQFEKGLTAMATTMPKGEDIVAASNVFNPSVGAQISNQVAKRADEVLAESEKLATDNNLVIFKDNMDAYTAEVKTQYEAVKQAPKEFTEDFSFNFDDLGIAPIVEEIGARIENPALKQRFVNTLTKIEQAAEGRGFVDLIDLRQAVNDIKFGSTTLKFSDKQALDSALKTIDNEIDNAAKTYIPNSNVWLDTWSKVKTNYAKMKEVEENVMYKALTRPGITEDTAVKVFSKYIAAADNTFYNVMEKLPMNVQKRIEGSVLNNMIEKFTVGAEGGVRAIHFPQLAKELGKVSWKASNNQQLVRTVKKMADVFKNDVNLVRATKGIEIPRFQSYLTVDPVMRAKYELASHGFNYVKRLVPGDTANTLALLNHTSRVLDNPLNAKSVKDMMGALPKDKRTTRDRLDVDNMIKNLQNLYAERQMAIRQMFNKDAPPRLVWNASPEKLQALQNPVSKVLPQGNPLFATQRGSVGTNPSELTLAERSDDLIAEFIWKNSNAKNDEIVQAASKYMDDNRFNNIMKSVSTKLVKDDIESNAKVVANSIKAEAGILRKRIEKDFGVKLPKEEAEKLVALKFKEVMEQCNGK